MEHYTAMKEKEVLLFATTLVDLDGIMLSEKVRPRETNAIWFHLFVESKNKASKQGKDRLVEIETKGMVTRTEWGWQNGCKGERENKFM